jgi:hypothetical protein
MSEFKEQHYDKRTVQRNIRAGLISDKAYQKYLASLPDSEPNAQVVRISPTTEAPPASTGEATSADDGADDFDDDEPEEG